MKLGRPELETEDIKVPFGATLKKKVIEELGRKFCKHLAESTINDYYQKRMKK
jgi:hypothetical protein